MMIARPVVARRQFRILIEAETVLAPACAVVLLLHPTPLTWPALVLGLLPSLCRLATFGRPWHPTAFDGGLALFVTGALAGQVVTLNPAEGGVRLAGLAGAVILFAWIREHALGPGAAHRAAVGALIVTGLGAVLMLHIAQPFLRFDRVAPLAWLAGLLEPLGLYRLLVADPEALQRFRLYASGAGAVAAVGLCISVGLAVTETRWRRLVPLGLSVLGFGGLLLAADNRGSMLAAALTIGCLIVWWRPRLLLLGVLLVFGTLDLIALGVVQRGFSLRTVFERLDFWQKGLELAAETPFTGVGLGVQSVQMVYRAAFQPAYPPFSHAHSIFVQALLEQGIIGLAGLVLLCVALARLGPARHDPADPGVRAASFAALGGALALLTAGLTEIVALTTFGSALLFALLGLLAATHDGDKHHPAAVVRAAQRLQGRASMLRPVVVLAALLAFATVIAVAFGRQIAALPFTNVGTTALYQGTLQPDAGRTRRDTALGRAVPALQTAIGIDPGNIAARRNLALAVAASGDTATARRLADTARTLADPDDRDALFGIGRAYAAAGAWDEAIGVWAQIGAGPQLLNLGRQLVRGDAWEIGNAALIAGARLGAPGRSADDAITRAALARGLTPAAAVQQLGPLLTSGGMEQYNAWLQAAHVYRQAGDVDLAESALTTATQSGLDDQLELERALIRVSEGRLTEAESALAWIVAHESDAPLGLPEGDDPSYWLAVVQWRLAKPADAIVTARAGLADLPTDQASLRAPYQAVLGECLLAIGMPDDALAAFRAGQRIAPSDPGLADGVRRAQAALPR